MRSSYAPVVECNPQQPSGQTVLPVEVVLINAWQSIMNGFDFSGLITIAVSIIPCIICVTVHELCHGAVAYMLGDPTAKYMGRLTLNPLKHIDITGFLMLLVFHFGWAKPVPVNMNNFKNPKRGMAVTALAGPVSNLLLAVIIIFLYGFSVPLCESSVIGYYVALTLNYTVYLSIGLAVFNFIPISPLDGSKILFSFLSDEAYRKLMIYERYGMIALIALSFTGVFSNIIGTAVNAVFNLILPVGELGLRLFYIIF